MKRNLLVQIALLLAFGGFAQMLPQRGPVNPEYLKYQDNLSKGLVSNVTADGHGLGYVPPVFKPDFSNYVPMNNPATLPAVYDMRTNGRLTSVKNQGGCGSCWTFATMGSMESRWKVLGLGDNDLSENNLKNCHLFDWTPCFGGNFNLSSAYMARRAGPVNETSDPYSATEQSCTTGLTPVAYEYSGCFLPANAAVIKQNLMDNGAIYTTFFWQDASYNSTNYTYYYSGTTETNHAVTIVGWDDTKVTAGGTGAWIIKNSWGSSWGENGYFYISYNDSRILTENGYFPSRSAYTATTKIYNYDDLGWIGNWGFSNAVGYGLVKYIASNNWPITKVGTWCNTSNTTIDIEIYDTFSGGTLSGLLGTLSGQSAPYPGYYLYDLPASIPMASGNDFYVKVKYNSPGALYPVPSEEVVAGYSSNVTIQTGKCWLSGDGTSWLALGTGTSYLFDLCIKAYTAQSSSTESIITLGTSANGLSYGVSGGQRTMLWADDNLKTVVNIHRMGPGTTPPGLSGYLATDIGTAMGQTTASWTVNRQAYASTLLSGTAYIDGGRYPQAAIYNPSGNTNQSNAYIG